MPSLERRYADRYAVSLAVEIHDEHGFTIHVAQNVSVGGAFVFHPAPIAVGEQLLLSFQIPGDGRPIRCDGAVVNIQDGDISGMGVRFVGMSTGDQERLRSFLEQVSQPGITTRS